MLFKFQCRAILKLTMHRAKRGTYAQKSSTVANLEMRRRLACHVLLLSFLKNHRAHLKPKETLQTNCLFSLISHVAHWLLVFHCKRHIFINLEIQQPIFLCSIIIPLTNRVKVIVNSSHSLVRDVSTLLWGKENRNSVVVLLVL